MSSIPKLTPMTVDDYLNAVDYSLDPSYVPSDFALHFLSFIKLVNGSEGEENKTPVMHLKMLDTLANSKEDTANLLFRGAAKTTVFGEYMFPYIALYGGIPNLKINVALYVTDSIDNGVKNMRKNLEYRWENSAFLQKYIPTIKFTDVRWEFINIDKGCLVVKGYGAKTGVRGAKEEGTRPQFALLDDLFSDEDANSPTVISKVEDTIYKAIDHALHPKNRRVIWNGTPFNQKDPLYKAIGSGGWAVNVFPVCEKFPCSKEEFRSAWPDRFDYEAVSRAYEKAVKNGKADAFYQELMLRIMSEEDRMILPSEIQWISRKHILLNKQNYNFYITTDFATSTKTNADFSVISVWAYTSNGDWILVDGVCKKAYLDVIINDLFVLCQKYEPQQVGIEVTGQQGGFIRWIQNTMIEKNTWFNLASSGNSNAPGIRPVADKLTRFNTIVPMFKMGKIFFAEELKDDPILQEGIQELNLVTKGGFKSKHDDFLDTVSMLTCLNPWKPSVGVSYEVNKSGLWEEVNDNYKENEGLNRYLV